jgi:acylphosphatase
VRVERRRIRVAGRVQGVGYRWFVMRRAKSFGLSGWVKNRFDGSVEMEVQGDSENIDLFELTVKDGPRLAAVSDMSSEGVPLREDERGFQIAFW